MLTLVVLLFISISVSIISIYFYAKSYDDFIVGVSMIFAGVSFIVVVGLLVNMFQYYAAGYKTSVINNEYRTSYSVDEVFYASDVIETVRELQRKRIEINGNIMGQCNESRR